MKKQWSFEQMKTSLGFRILTFPVCIFLVFVTGFLLSFIGKAVYIYHVAMDPWPWAVNRSLRSFSIDDFFLGLVFILPAAWLLKKIASAWMQTFSAIVAVMVAAWFGI